MARFHLLFARLQLLGSIVFASLQPPCRKSAEMDTLLDGKELVIYGGKGYKLSTTGLFLDDTWQFDLDGKNQWNNLSTLAPSARWKTATAPVATGKLWILFGGCLDVSASGVQNDLWVFSARSSTWRQVSTENAPPPRRGHVVATNATHLVVFGGKSWQSGHVTVLKDLWALPLSALDEGAPIGRWTQGATFPAAARWGATGTVIKQQEKTFSNKCLLGCKTERELLVVYGGRVKVNKEYVYFESLYVYDFIADSWSEIQPCGLTPGARDHHAATAFANDLWVFGGRTEPTRKYRADVADLWSYSLSKNRWTRHKWKGIGPSRRFMPSISGLRYHGNAAIAVFGGEHFAKRSEPTLWNKKWELLNDLWVFDTVQKRWFEILPTNCPGIPVGAEPLPLEMDEEMDDAFWDHGDETEGIDYDADEEIDDELAVCSIVDSFSTTQWVLILTVAFATAAFGVGFAIRRPRVRSANARSSTDEDGLNCEYIRIS